MTTTVMSFYHRQQRIGIHRGKITIKFLTTLVKLCVFNPNFHIMDSEASSYVKIVVFYS